MSHYKESRKQQADTHREQINDLYRDYWGKSLDRIIDLDGQNAYETDDNKTVADWHDIAGADTGLVIETEHGGMITFVEEKTRYYDADGYADSPDDVDLALTTEYPNKSFAPKHKKHLELRTDGMFIPSWLFFGVHDSAGMCRCYLIDYNRLLAWYDAIEAESTEHHNQRDGNVTRYVEVETLDQYDLIEERWTV